jgi:hypothetical protein
MADATEFSQPGEVVCVARQPCAALSVEIQTPDAAVADEFAPLTVVVTNKARRAIDTASIPTGARLLHMEFSTPVGNGSRAALPTGYSCTPPSEPVTSIDCSATNDDVIAIGTSRTFQFRIDTPADPQRLDSHRRVEVTAQVDPDNALSNIRDGRDNVVRRFDVAPPAFSTVFPSFFFSTSPGVIQLDFILAFSCSTIDPVGGVAFGSMTCLIGYHPSIKHASGVLSASTSFFAMVDNLKFNTAAAFVPGGNCSGSTGFGSGGGIVAPHNIATLRCDASISFHPNESVNVGAFSVWVDPSEINGNGDTDWTACADVRAATADLSSCGSFGGSAGD